MKTFNLPDLGEGLPEAEIVSWHVKEGDTVLTDQPLVSVETAKAVVEVPSPYSGRIVKLHANDGDIVATGAPLVDFDIGDEAETAPPPVEEPGPAAADTGTVVGSMPTSDEVVVETAIAGGRRRRERGRVKAAPAVRALAKRLGVDLTQVTPTGRNSLVTPDDVHRHAGDQTQTPLASARPPASVPTGEPERLRGPRRAMAQSMAKARDEVSPCTLFDDADIHDWRNKREFTVRIIRAIVAGCRAEPGLNAWFDGESTTRRIMPQIDLAMAVDTPDGLIVPVLRDVGSNSAGQLRAQLDLLKEATRNRTVAPEDMQNFTFTLSNFGMMAGRYATPVIVPPTVAILGAGGVHHDVVAVMGGIEVHRRIPLSLTFDHRCITGGEACRFLAALIADLEESE